MTPRHRLSWCTKRFRRVAFAILAALAIASSVHAQNTSELLGEVTDQSGGVLPGATIRATHVATGTSRDTVTDDRGGYVLHALAVGIYTITADLQGFTPVTREGITLMVGQRVRLDMVLDVTGVKEQVIVTGGTPLVDLTSSDVTSNLDLRQMQELPLVGRDWLSMTALAPGVRSTTTGIPTVGGQGTQRTKILVDGNQINRNFNYGSGTNFEFSQEAIREVEVVTNRMSAEFARAGGGVVSAVTKSGTNQLSASAYGFFRDGKFNAEDFFTGRQEPFSNKVTGFTVGGPILKNRFFYFGNMEWTRRTQTNTFGTGIPVLDVTYPFDFKRDTAFARFDYRFNDMHQLNVRTGRDKNEQLYATASPGLSAGWHLPQRGWLIGGTLTSVFGSRTVNEATVQYFPFDWTRDQQNTAPGFMFPAARLGTSNNALAFGLKEYMTFLRNTLSHNKSTRWGDHNLKTGVEYVYVAESGAFADIFFGQFLVPGNPSNWPAALAAIRANDMAAVQQLVSSGVVPVPTTATFGVGDPRFNTPQPLLGLFFQDDWRIHPRLTLNLGLRYDADYGAYITDLDTRYTRDHGKPETDMNNIAPRVGFAWSLDDSNRTVVRGGVGRYFDQVHNNFTFAAQIFNGDTYAQITTLPGNPPRPDFITNPLGGLTLEAVVANPALAAQNIRPFSKDFVTSSTDQYAIGFGHQLSQDFAVNADLLHIIGLNESYYIDTNVFCNPGTTDPLPVPTFGRPDPRYNTIRTASSGGHSRYEGLQTSVTKRFSNNYQFGGSYTLSWSRSNSGSNTQTNHPEPCGLGAAYGLSEQDQRHRATFNLVYQFPWDIHVGAVFVATSGRRFLTNAGRDLNRDLENNDLARNPDGTKMLWAGGLGEPVARVDLRVSKSIRLFGPARVELIGEAINLFNRKNYNSYNGNQSSPAFLQPVRTSDLNFQPFQAQFGFRFTY